jgi:hypothetical protein
MLDLWWEVNDLNHSANQVLLNVRAVMIVIVYTTNIVSLNPAHGEVYLMQHYVIKFVSDLRQVCSFLRTLRFLTDCHDKLKYCRKWH